MRFGTAIERLVDNYQYAKSKVWIWDEVAWALYHTWKEADDRKTEPNSSEKPNNSTISKMEQVEDEFKQFDREDLILLIECQKERIAELLADKDTPQTEYDKYREKIKAHDPHKYGFEDEPQTDCAWK